MTRQELSSLPASATTVAPQWCSVPAGYTVLAQAARQGYEQYDDHYQLFDPQQQLVATLSENRAQQQKNGTCLTLFDERGGLTAMLRFSEAISPLKYFGLPGSSIHVGGLQVEMCDVLHNVLAETAVSDTLPQSPSSLSVPKPLHQQAVTPFATILGAGLATRFEPISGQQTGYAKPAVPLCGSQSVIACLVERLKQQGFDRLFINTFYLAESLKAGLQHYDVLYLDEACPSGTAGGLRTILEQLTANDSAETYTTSLTSSYMDPHKPLLVVQGDAVTDADFAALMDAHCQNRAAITIGCQPVNDEDVDKFGIVVTDQSGADGQSGRIVDFKEKPSRQEAGSHRLANTGFYILAPQVFPVVLAVYRHKQQQQITNASQTTAAVTDLDFARDLFPEVLRQVQAGLLKDEAGQPMTFWAERVTAYWSDVGNPMQYWQTLQDVYQGRVNLSLPLHEALETYYDAAAGGVVYWPGTHALSRALKAKLTGRVIVTQPFLQQ